MRLNKDTILNNRYKIISLAGKGGMAFVYKAVDLDTDEIVAIKVLKDEYYDDAEFVHRFDLEARAAASLYHPNIVNVFGLGQDNKLRYIVQEYVEGRSLREELEEKKKLDWRIAVPISIQIALALEHAHSQGIIHRDIKAANILMTENGICKVTDFGIARAANSNTVSASGGTALGSVHYFSPEQARGGAVDFRTDIYSLGILMYELVTGELPFDDETSVAVALKHLQEQPKKPSKLEPSVPTGLEDIILSCLQKNPDNRYDNARELIDDLDNFMINPNERYGTELRENRKLAKLQDETSLAYARENSDGGDSLRRIIHLEKSINSRRRSKARDAVLTTLLIVLAAAALFFGVWLIINQFRSDLGQNQEDTDVFIMENFVGKDYESVSAYLRTEGLNHIRLEESSETVAAGKIISQNIPEGMSINKNATFVRGSEIILTVSRGSEFTIIPDVIGKGSAEMKAQLENVNNLTVLSREQYSIDIEPGKIISISPQVGTTVERGSRVTITISKGANRGPVPDVRGQKVSEAVEYLNSIAFKTKIQIPETLIGEEDSLYVVSMDPKPQTSNVTGEIVLLAGTYEEANPTPTPRPTTTTSTTESTTSESSTEESLESSSSITEPSNTEPTQSEEIPTSSSTAAETQTADLSDVANTTSNVAPTN